MINPCKQGKCILYPICISKEDLDCHILRKYVSLFIKKCHVGHSKNYVVEDSEIFDDINKFLPRLKQIRYIAFSLWKPDLRKLKS